MTNTDRLGRLWLSKAIKTHPRAASRGRRVSVRSSWVDPRAFTLFHRAVGRTRYCANVNDRRGD